MTALREESYATPGQGLAGRFVERVSTRTASMRRRWSVAPAVAKLSPAPGGNALAKPDAQALTGNGLAPEDRTSTAGRPGKSRRKKVKRGDYEAELEVVRRSLEAANEELRRQNLAVRE